MITHANTPASEIFGGFKGPKIAPLHFTFTSLSLSLQFFSLEIKEKDVARDILFFGLTPRGESPFVQEVAPRKPIRLLTRKKSPCSDDHLREHFRLRNFQPI